MQRALSATLGGMLLALFLPTDTFAQFDFGGYTFPDRSAFADEASEVGSPPPGTGLLPSGTTSINTALTDINLGTWVIAGGSAGMADVRFTDNVIVNESGPDCVLFQYGAGDPYRIMVGANGAPGGLSALVVHTGTRAIDVAGRAVCAESIFPRICYNTISTSGIGE